MERRRIDGATRPTRAGSEAPRRQPGRSASRQPPQRHGQQTAAQRSRTAGPAYGGRGRSQPSEPPLCEQVLEALTALGVDGVYADCTFGAGGHSRALLNKLSPSATLLVLDVDPTAITDAQALAGEDSRVQVHHMACSELVRALTPIGEKLSGVLFDWGPNELSERDPTRGLMYHDDCPCDLRMNPTLGEPAAEWLSHTSSEELAWVIREFGDDEDPLIAARVAEAIVQRIKRRPFRSARELAEWISRVKGDVDSKARHPAKGTFQAIRTYLNQEPQQLWAGLFAAFDSMKVGGRCVVITYHRWEMILARRFSRDFEDFEKRRVLGWSLERLTQLYPLLTKNTPWAVVEVCSPVQPTAHEMEVNKKARGARGLVFEKAPRLSSPSPAIWHPRDCQELERLLFSRPDKVPIFEGEAIARSDDAEPETAAPTRSERGVMTPPLAVQSIGEWLREVGGREGKLLQYEASLEAKFGTVARILRAATGSVGSGNDCASFFAQASIQKLGHRRLFQLWFTSHGSALSPPRLSEEERSSASACARGGRPRSRPPAAKRGSHQEESAGTSDILDYFRTLQRDNADRAANLTAAAAAAAVAAERAEEERLLFSEKPTGFCFEEEDELRAKRFGTNADKVAHLGSSFEDLFQEFDVPSWLRKNLARCRTSRPALVQRQFIPYALIGRDVLAIAPAGSGKTLAYLIHLAIAIPEASTASEGISLGRCYEGAAKPLALVLASTREQCNSILLEARRLCCGSPFRLASVFGGIGLRSQAATLANGCDLCITTPNRFGDVVERGILSLEAVGFLVLDEANAMLDIGLESKIRQLIESSGMPDSQQRQTIFVTSPPVSQAMQDFASAFLFDRITIEVCRSTGSKDTVSQVLHWVSPDEKMERLLEILSDDTVGRTLIFVRRRKDASELLNLLRFAGREAAALHGELPPEEREAALTRFRQPAGMRALIVTDLVGRGLDLPDVQRVVNFDLPATLDEYQRRIGQAGRAGGRAVAVSLFVSRGEGANLGIARGLIDLLRKGRFRIPEGLEADVEARCAEKGI